MTKKREAHPIIHLDDFHAKKTGFVESYKASWQEAGVIASLWLDVVERDHWQPGHYRSHAYELTPHLSTVSERPLGASQMETAFLLLRELRGQVLAAMREAGWQEADTTREGQPIYVYRPGPPFQLVPPAAEDAVTESDLPDIDLSGAGADVLGENQPHEEALAELGDEIHLFEQTLERWGRERKAPGLDVAGEASQSKQGERKQPDQGDQREPEQRKSHTVQVVGNAEARARGQQAAYSRQVFTRPITFTCIVCEQTVTQQRYPGHTPLYCSDACQEERVVARTRERVARHREKKKAEAAAQDMGENRAQ